MVLLHSLEDAELSEAQRTGAGQSQPNAWSINQRIRLSRRGAALSHRSCASSDKAEAHESCAYERLALSKFRVGLLSWGRACYGANAYRDGRLGCPSMFASHVYMTGGTVMPMTARARISSRRTTATVASKNCFRFSSASVRIGWRW